MSVDPRTVVVTRMGVGVFDRLWWDTRLSLFRSVTAASIARFKDRDLVWAILLDADVPKQVHQDIHDIFDSLGLSNQVRFWFVPDHSHLGDTVRHAIRSETAPNRPIHAQLLDDDDAISPRLHDSHLEAFDPTVKGPQAASTPTGIGIDAPRLRRGHLTYASHVPNTSFFGTAESVADLLLSSHRRWLQTAEKKGGRAHLIESPTDDWLYLYHQQGDGDYEQRIAKFRGDMEPLAQSKLEPFGIDLQEFTDSVRRFARTPPTLGLTWRRTQPQQYALLSVKKRARELKQQSIRINSDLFGNTVAFFYVRGPLPGKSQKAGKVIFSGVGTPGTRIELWIRGQRDFTQKNSTECNSEDGTWSISQTFRAAEWTVKLRQIQDESEVGTFTYRLAVK